MEKEELEENIDEQNLNKNEEEKTNAIKIFFSVFIISPVLTICFI